MVRGATRGLHEFFSYIIKKPISLQNGMSITKTKIIVSTVFTAWNLTKSDNLTIPKEKKIKYRTYS